MKKITDQDIIDYARDNGFDVFDDSDLEKQYDEMLDECSTVEIGVIKFDASRVLQEMDPTAYRCGYSDYTDSLELDELDDIDGNTVYISSNDVCNIKQELEGGVRL